MAQLQLDIVTPDQTLACCEVDYVSATGVEGEFGILPNHAPLLAALCVGKMCYRIAGKWYHLYVGGGFIQVLDNTVTVLAEVAEFGDKIDKTRAEQAEKRAKQRLETRDGHIDEARARAALSRAVVRLQIASLD